MLPRFQGCIVGLAVGDALGWPTEFIHDLSIIRSKYGPDGLTDLVAGRHPAGTYTDDTQMSLCVARALIEAGKKSLDELMQVMAREFVEWSNSPDNNRAPGGTCMAGCQNLEQGLPWRDAGVPHSTGCGSAMRTAPIGLYFWDDEARLIEVARASSVLTHRHPITQSAAAATALLVAWAIRGDNPDHYPERLSKIMHEMDGGHAVAELVAQVPHLLDRNPDEVLCAGVLGESWAGHEAVASALYCFCRSPKDYRQTVITGANTVGDSDSIACIAGAISGAYNGIDSIPEKWRQTVENSATLHDLASELLRATKCEADR